MTRPQDVVSTRLGDWANRYYFNHLHGITKIFPFIPDNKSIEILRMPTVSELVQMMQLNVNCAFIDEKWFAIFKVVLLSSSVGHLELLHSLSGMLKKFHSKMQTHHSFIGLISPSIHSQFPIIGKTYENLLLFLPTKKKLPPNLKPKIKNWKIAIYITAGMKIFGQKINVCSSSLFRSLSPSIRSTRSSLYTLYTNIVIDLAVYCERLFYMLERLRFSIIKSCLTEARNSGFFPRFLFFFLLLPHVYGDYRNRKNTKKSLWKTKKIFQKKNIAPV